MTKMGRGKTECKRKIKGEKVKRNVYMHTVRGGRLPEFEKEQG